MKTFRGFGGKTNTVLYWKPENAESRTTRDIIFYFGGDVQDFEERMRRHTENKSFVEWSFEKTGLLLRQAKPDHHVVIVRPSTMTNGTFSKFEHFVPSDDLGCPRHSSEVATALPHLNDLYRSLLVEEIGETDRNRNDRLTLIGFSKGVVVLNQIVFELQAIDERSDLFEFVRRISKMCWLDGGHNGGRDTWISDQGLLKRSFLGRKISCDVRVTPYQVRDRRRPWIGQEEEAFSRHLSQLLPADDFRRKLYFGNEDRDVGIDEHFAVLKTLLDDPL